MALTEAEKRERKIKEWLVKYRDKKWSISKIFNAPNRVGIATTYQRLVRLALADDDGYVDCISCGRSKHVNVMEGGHFVGRKNLATIVDFGNGLIQNVWPQCKFCNKYSEGSRIEFRAALIEKFGEADVLKLERARLPKNHVWNKYELATLKVNFVDELKAHERRIGLR